MMENVLHMCARSLALRVLVENENERHLEVALTSSASSSSFFGKQLIIPSSSFCLFNRFLCSVDDKEKLSGSSSHETYDWNVLPKASFVSNFLWISATADAAMDLLAEYFLPPKHPAKHPKWQIEIYCQQFVMNIKIYFTIDWKI